MHPVEDIVVAAIAMAVVVIVPPVFNWVRRELGFIEADLPKQIPTPPLPPPEAKKQ